MKGLGNKHANIHVYIQNIPPLPQYQQLTSLRPMQAGEISVIAEQTGNHWRKIFNVFAKLAYQLNTENFSCWQQLRELSLLQKNSNYALLFDAPTFLPISNSTHNQESIEPTTKVVSQPLTLILGKGYASNLTLAEQALWLNNDFAINNEQHYIICPYFDYRQLSNIKIDYLCQLINQMTSKNSL